MHQVFQDPLAVIDIGSNSARLVIYTYETTGHLRILGSARHALRLVRDMDRRRRLSAEAIKTAMRALNEFRSVIDAHAARRVIAVATAAMRDAVNGSELIEQARVDFGFDIQVIDSNKEGYYGCLGGIRGLPVHEGIVFDLGGGSMQI